MPSTLLHVAPFSHTGQVSSQRRPHLPAGHSKRDNFVSNDNDRQIIGNLLTLIAAISNVSRATVAASVPGVALVALGTGAVFGAAEAEPENSNDWFVQ